MVAVASPKDGKPLWTTINGVILPAAESGTLKFTIDDISPIEDNSYWVMGQYHLTRTVGDANGNFLIIFKKIDGRMENHC